MEWPRLGEMNSCQRTAQCLHIASTQLSWCEKQLRKLSSYEIFQTYVWGGVGHGEGRDTGEMFPQLIGFFFLNLCLFIVFLIALVFFINVDFNRHLSL